MLLLVDFAFDGEQILEKKVGRLFMLTVIGEMLCQAVRSKIQETNYCSH
jgi:hypothetical protein